MSSSARKRTRSLMACAVMAIWLAVPVMASLGQETIVVRPKEIDNVLVNPGIGFMTFQRFNGDKLNEGKAWTEGFPIVYQPFAGKLETEGHPMTSLYDAYPQGIIRFGMKDAWQKAPVSLEVCWVMQHWKDMGWDIDYIIDQSLKWHISSFNGKSSAVPKEWWPQVNRWLKRMGYRFVLRKFTFPAKVKTAAKFEFTSWWENKGVAPCYRPFRLAFRLRGQEHSAVLAAAADIRTWLPGDNLCDGALPFPPTCPRDATTWRSASWASSPTSRKSSWP